jgi:hypothetical protein
VLIIICEETEMFTLLDGKVIQPTAKDKVLIFISFLN